MPLQIGNTTINSTTASTFSDDVVQRGLVIHLDAQAPASYSGSGTSWIDLGYTTGDSNNFTTVSGTYSSGPPAYWHFNGTSQLAYCANKVPSDYVTVECVFRRIGAIGGDDILWNKEETWEMRTVGNTIQWAIYTTTTTWFWYTAVSSINLNQTYLVSLTFDGSSIKTYLNGTLRDTYSYSGVLANQNSYWPKLNARGTVQNEGTSNSGNHYFYSFRVYNRALYAGEILHNYNVQKDRFGM